MFCQEKSVDLFVRTAYRILWGFMSLGFSDIVVNHGVA